MRQRAQRMQMSDMFEQIRVGRRDNSLARLLSLLSQTVSGDAFEIRERGDRQRTSRGRATQAQVERASARVSGVSHDHELRDHGRVARLSCHTATD